MKETALLDGEEKQEAINEAEELLEVVVDGEVARLEAGAEGLVGRVLDEAGAEGEQGVGDAGAQAIADALALFLALFFPRFPRVGVTGGVVRAGAAGLEEPPDGGEVGVTLGAEDDAFPSAKRARPECPDIMILPLRNASWVTPRRSLRTTTTRVSTISTTPWQRSGKIRTCWERSRNSWLK